MLDLPLFAGALSSAMFVIGTLPMVYKAFVTKRLHSWDAKYTYWSFRPNQMDSVTTTVFPTPSYPSYPSGHACVSNAIAEVIASEFPAYAESIRARAAEAYESRIWAGIHFRHEMVAGKAIGVAVAQQVLDAAE